MDALNLIRLYYFMLNSEQLELQKLIKKFINGDKNGFFGVLGAGGVGKTHTICESIPINEAIFLGATNKVVGVLKAMIKSKGLFGTKAKTLDAFFNFKMIKDHENNTHITHRMPSLKDVPDIIVIDEVSLITDRVCELLLELKDYRKIILMGDDMQLPPISNDNETNGIRVDGFLKSKIFSLMDNTFTLTIQQRQKEGSRLSKLINGFRQNMHKPMPFKALAQKASNNNDVFNFMDRDTSFINLIRSDDVTCVCYKNLTALSFNWLIGSTKYNKSGYKVNEINVGDTVFFDGYYKNKDITFYTSEHVEILQIQENCTEVFEHEERSIPFTFKKVKVKRKDEDAMFVIWVSNGYQDTMSSIYTKLRYDREKIKKNNNPLTLGNKRDLSASFTAYNNFSMGFAKLKKPFAITSHKAQGSTFENVIIPIYDYGNKNHCDVNQLFYVAMSRAKERIIFVDRCTKFKENSNRYHFSEYERNAICSSFNYKCANCSVDIDDIRLFEIDHKRPLAVGGLNTMENLQPLCKSCHKEKTSKEKYR